jgi:hypothetical protein
MGGVAGHLSHIHENLDFTFGEIKSVLSDVASADMEVIEKVDGQNLFFGWDAKTGEIRTARNPSDIKKGGMTPTEYADKWANHPVPSVREAFTQGLRAIETGVNSLSQEQLVQIFGENTDTYVNAEVMYTGNPNIINYGANYIVLHNIQKFDDSGAQINPEGKFQALVDAVSGAESSIDEQQWTTYGPQIVELKKFAENDNAPYEKLVADLDALGMSDDATVRDFVSERLRSGIVGNIPIPVFQQEKIIKIITGDPSAPSYAAVKKELPKSVHKTVSALATKTNSRKTISKETAPIERAISDFAIEVLRGLQSFFVDDADAEIARMREELEVSITAIEGAQGADAESLGQLLDTQLEKLGPIENVASTLEGVVFEHPPGSHKLYKLTGSFAMVNQIVGRAARMKPAEQQNESALGGYLRRMGYLPFLVG